MVINNDIGSSEWESEGEVRVAGEPLTGPIPEYDELPPMLGDLGFESVAEFMEFFNGLDEDAQSDFILIMLSAMEE